MRFHFNAVSIIIAVLLRFSAYATKTKHCNGNESISRKVAVDKAISKQNLLMN